MRTAIAVRSVATTADFSASIAAISFGTYGKSERSCPK
jgi:hypothetical protein